MSYFFATKILTDSFRKMFLKAFYWVIDIICILADTIQYYLNKIVICIALRCTHEPFKSVRELGLPKTEIKVKNCYTFRGIYMKHQPFFAMIFNETSIKHCLFKISFTIVHN